MLKQINEVCDYVWQSSKFDGGLLFSVLALVQRGEHFCAVFLLLAMLEKICSRVVDDFDLNFKQVLKKLFEKGIISEQLHQYLNGDKQYTSVRDIRNIMTHKDLYSYVIVKNNGEQKVFYSLSEDDSWKEFYDGNAMVLFNIIYELLFEDIKIAKEVDSILSKNNNSCLNLMADNCQSYVVLLH